MKKRALTGIKPTGNLHIGNFVGAIQPMLKLATDPNFTTNIFIADYHALNLAEGRANIRQNSYAIAASYLALGLNPEGCTFYRQSDVPETFELTTFLTSFTPKGLMNRAHAYKAVTQANREQGVEDEDIGVNMGLYIYPILMAADIVLFDADVVPVGKDQKQHIEFARDIAGSVNSVYGQVLKLPEAMISEETMELPGIDGRKMSKSYGNVLPIFAPKAELEKICMRVKTDSRTPDEPKDPNDSILYKLYVGMADEAQAKRFHDRFVPGGMGYGQAKKELAELLDTIFGPAREKYNALMASPETIDKHLDVGAAKARALAQATLKRIREAAGFRV